MVNEERDKEVLLTLAGILYQVFRDDDKKLSIHRVEIERSENYADIITKITFYTSRPALLIGKHGESINQVTALIKRELWCNPVVSIEEYEPIPILSGYSSYIY